MYKVTHTFTCKVCNKEFQQTYQSATIQNPVATIPAGWSQLPDGYICNDHIITITDKQGTIDSESIEIDKIS